jgi:DNA-binding protein H-NS
MKPSKPIIAPAKLRQLSVDELLTLRDAVEKILDQRVEQERRELQARLRRLQGFESDKSKKKNGGGVTAMSSQGRTKLKLVKKTVPPKYRNPDRAEETWTGRGLRPRWLTAALNSGKSIEDFRISA